MPNHYPSRGLTLCFILSLAFSGHAAIAEEQANRPQKIDPKAKKVIRQLVEHIGTARTVAVDILLDGKAKISERRHVRREGDCSVTIEKPRKVAVVSRISMGTTSYTDGKTLWSYHASGNVYATRLMRAGFGFEEIIFHFVTDTASGHTALPFVSNLLAGKSVDELIKNLKAADYLGVAEERGTKCHRLKLTRGKNTWEMWVTAGDKPVIQKMIEQGISTGSGSIEGTTPIMITTIRYDNWKLHTKLPAETFTFTPPEGAKILDRSASKKAAQRRKQPQF